MWTVLDWDESVRVLLIALSMFVCYYLDLYYTEKLAHSLILYITGQFSQLNQKQQRLQALLIDLRHLQTQAHALNNPNTFTQHALLQRQINELQNTVQQLQLEITVLSQFTGNTNPITQAASKLLKLTSILASLLVFIYWNQPCGRIPNATFMLTWRIMKKEHWPPGSLHVLVWTWMVRSFAERIHTLLKKQS